MINERILIIVLTLLISINYYEECQCQNKKPSTLTECAILKNPHEPLKGFSNPDSVMVDSCQNPKLRLVKGWFTIIFNNYVIDLPQAPEDTLLDVTWESITSSYLQLRTDFEEMENKFGGYKLRKITPDVIDSTHIGSRAFSIDFENYVIEDSVLTFLGHIQGLFEYYYRNRVNIY